MLDSCVCYTKLLRLQRIFAIFYAGFPQGALEKSTPMRLPPFLVRGMP
jgi:hypothetical protein